MLASTRISEGYRFGFNGMEKDNEVKGIGNSLDFGARIYDSRLGKWLSTDPLQNKYPSLSPYDFVANSPIKFVDPDGKRVDLSMMSEARLQDYKSALKVLNKSELFRMYYSELVNSKETYYVKWADKKFNKGGSYDPNTKIATLSNNNSYTISQELFHVYQDDIGEYVPEDHSNVETEGDIMSFYVANEVGGVTPTSMFSWARGLMFEYIDKDGKPLLNKILSEQFESDFQEGVDKRIEYYKERGEKEKTDKFKNYTFPKSKAGPKGIKKVVKALKNNKVGPVQEDGSF